MPASTSMCVCVEGGGGNCWGDGNTLVSGVALVPYSAAVVDEGSGGQQHTAIGLSPPPVLVALLSNVC